MVGKNFRMTHCIVSLYRSVSRKEKTPPGVVGLDIVEDEESEGTSLEDEHESAHQRSRLTPFSERRVLFQTRRFRGRAIQCMTSSYVGNAEGRRQNVKHMLRKTCPVQMVSRCDATSLAPENSLGYFSHLYPLPYVYKLHMLEHTIVSCLITVSASLKHVSVVRA